VNDPNERLPLLTLPKPHLQALAYLTVTTPDNTRLAQLERENLSLKRAVDELSVLNELAKAIGGERDTDRIMRRIVSRSVSTVGCEQGVITLVDDTAMNPMETLVRTVSDSTEHAALRPDDSLLGWMHINKQALVVNDPSEDPRFRGARWNDQIQSLCCVPLLVQGGLIGILTVYNKKSPEGFADNDKRLLSILAAQSAQVLENARLYDEEVELMELHKQMDVARLIQTRLLPEKSPHVEGFDISGFSRPALQVGGDFYNVIAVSEESTFVWVGDVSGKGLPASLTMANSQAVLHSHAEAGRTVAECVSIANDLLHTYTPRNTFVTLVVAEIRKDGAMRICNAGHVKPVIVRANGEAELVEPSDLVVGVMRGRRYQSTDGVLEPGDCMVLYSDGVGEALDEDRNLLGDDAPVETVKRFHKHSASYIVQELVKEVDAHAGKAEQADDITVLAVKRLA
jgi:sigma-B regulation protein RsbU (phosphoserine phosphatase)